MGLSHSQSSAAISEICLEVELVAVGELPAPASPEWRDILTPSELAYCSGKCRTAEHLAARLAAKRAVTKAVGWKGEPPWSEMEIERSEGGRPWVRVTGEFLRWISMKGVRQMDISLSHCATHAAAQVVVINELRRPEP